jgi:hypothetical protein
VAPHGPDSPETIRANAATPPNEAATTTIFPMLLQLSTLQRSSSLSVRNWRRSAKAVAPYGRELVWPAIAGSLRGLQAVTLVYLLTGLGYTCLFVGVVVLWFELTERHY